MKQLCVAPDDAIHVAIIMDGNGRWARSRGRARVDGHREGAERVREVVTRCRERGVRYLTLYAFSTENWRRSPREVNTLMVLLRGYLTSEIDELQRHGIELTAVGDVDRLPTAVQRTLNQGICATRGLDSMRLTLALSYGGRDEITRAVRRVVTEVHSGNLPIDGITESLISERLDTAGTPDPDLVIRTSGERRLSNFLLWQVAYSELYFTHLPWPEFGAVELDQALDWYHRRSRRFGLVEKEAV